MSYGVVLCLSLMGMMLSLCSHLYILASGEICSLCLSLFDMVSEFALWPINDLIQILDLTKKCVTSRNKETNYPLSELLTCRWSQDWACALWRLNRLSLPHWRYDHTEDTHWEKHTHAHTANTPHSLVICTHSDGQFRLINGSVLI